MNDNSHDSTFLDINDAELVTVTGGAGRLDFEAIRAKAKAYCPETVGRYAGLDPTKVARSGAQKMGNECLAEMGSFRAGFARGPIQRAIDTAFPR